MLLYAEFAQTETQGRQIEMGEIQQERERCRHTRTDMKNMKDSCQKRL